MTDRLKTVYPPKTLFCGGYKESKKIQKANFIFWEGLKLLENQVIKNSGLKREKKMASLQIYRTCVVPENFLRERGGIPNSQKGV